MLPHRPPLLRAAGLLREGLRLLRQARLLREGLWLRKGLRLRSQVLPSSFGRSVQRHLHREVPHLHRLQLVRSGRLWLWLWRRCSGSSGRCPGCGSRCCPGPVAGRSGSQEDQQRRVGLNPTLPASTITIENLPGSNPGQVAFLVWLAANVLLGYDGEH